MSPFNQSLKEQGSPLFAISFSSLDEQVYVDFGPWHRSSLGI